MTPDALLDFVRTLPGTSQKGHTSNIGLKVAGKGFGYLGVDSDRLLLKATMDEREALVAEDPETFTPSFTAGQFAWVEISLATVRPDELTELVTEAWRLTAPKRLVVAFEAAAG